MRITILAGGSSEREVSILSGNAVKKALIKLGHKVEVIDTKDPQFLHYDFNTDLVFNALHGGMGENGIFQGLFEIHKIPYTGSGVLASALAMNKVFSRRIFNSVGINVANAVHGIESEVINNKEIAYPFIIKPIDGGSSIGIKIIKNKEEKSKLYTSNEEVLIESYIEGREVSVAIFKDSVLGMIEILFPQEMYDYEAKYSSTKTTYSIPSDIDNILTNKIYEYALLAHRSLGCKGLTRADFRLDKNNKLKPILLEINTLPGLTDHSLVPKIAKNVGISFTELISMIVEDALN